MTSRLAQDIAFGLTSENEMISILNAKFNTNVKQLEKYNVFDFETKTRLIELKSRNCRHQQYPTTMISNFKIIEAENKIRKYILYLNLQIQ